MIERDLLANLDLTLSDPVRQIQQVSYDNSLAALLTLKSKGTISALDVQFELLDRARKMFEDDGAAEVASDDEVKLILSEWEMVLQSLDSVRRAGGIFESVGSTGAEPLVSRVDWYSKFRLIKSYAERNALDFDSHKLKAIALQYHDMRPSKSLADRAGHAILINTDSARLAVSQPPESTRAWFRGQCLMRYSDSITSANWDSIVFDLGNGPLRRVPMMEPLKGTKELAGQLLDSSATSADLVNNLGA